METVLPWLSSVSISGEKVYTGSNFKWKKKMQKDVVSFSALCEGKMGLIRYNPKGKWKIEGQLCRKCWDEKKSELG